MILAVTWPFPLVAERWAQRCRASGAAVYSLDGRLAARLVAGTAPPNWRLVVGPRAPLEWARRTRAAVVVTADDDDVPPPELAALASEVWASSSLAAGRMTETGWPGDVKLMPYLGAAPALLPAPGSTRSAQPWRLVCTARPAGGGGVEDVLEAAAVLRRAGDAVLVRLVDDGTAAAAALRRRAAELGLGGAVEVAELRSLGLAARWLDWAHAFVLPAVADGGWPEVAEAQRAGLAMVVGDQPTLRTRLDGWPLADLVPPGSPEAVAGALRARLGGVPRCGRNSRLDVGPSAGEPDARAATPGLATG